MDASFFSDPRSKSPFVRQWKAAEYSVLHHEKKWLNVTSTDGRVAAVGGVSWEEMGLPSCLSSLRNQEHPTSFMYCSRSIIQAEECQAEVD